MVEEQKPSDIDALKKELADIKNEMARKELEDIKRDKMRLELEELKAEQAKTHVVEQYYEPHKPKLSILTTIMAILTLAVAGYVLGTLYGYNLAAEADRYLTSYQLPISGSLLLTIASVVLIFIGLGFVTIAKK